MGVQRIVERARTLVQAFDHYFGRRSGTRRRPIESRDGLREFIRTRASHVAQTALYGYLKTRAGTRFPSLFEDDRFVASINIAKWHVWLACVADLTVYVGGRLQDRAGGDTPVAALMLAVFEEILDETGAPAEAGDHFEQALRETRAAIAARGWEAIPDDDEVFARSPSALVEWAPIVESLKQLDEEIVRNSVRFRWHEVMRETRRLLDAKAVLSGAPGGQADSA